MPDIKRLPDAEFELMRIIWNNETPITTNRIMEHLGSNKKWKPQTVLTMLVRLVEKEFLASGKTGRERHYTPLITEDAYMEIETSSFKSRYFGKSLGSLIKTMYDGQDLTDADVDELQQWLKLKRNNL